MKIVKILFLFVFFLNCTFLASCGKDENIKARHENLAPFSIDLPDGWLTNIPEGIECTVGRCVAGFTKVNTGSRLALTVSVVPSLGKNLSELMDEATKNQFSNDADMKLLQKSDTKVHYKGTIKGNEADLTASLDASTQQLAILLVVGDDKEVYNIADTIELKNKNLSFK